MKRDRSKIHNRDRDMAIAALSERVQSLEHIFDAMVKYLRKYMDWKGDLVPFSEEQEKKLNEERSMAQEKQETETKMDNAKG